MQALEDKYTMAKKFHKSLLSYQKADFIDAKDYLETVLELTEELSGKQLLQEYELSRVFDCYLKYIVPYIFDFFNHKNTVDEKRAIRELNSFLTLHLLQIIEFYMQKLETKLSKG